MKRCIILNGTEMYKEVSCVWQGQLRRVVMARHHIIDNRQGAHLQPINAVIDGTESKMVRHEMEGCQLLVGI
jgi:hypothetical protein